MIIDTLSAVALVGAWLPIALADLFGGPKTTIKVPAPQLPAQSALEAEQEARVGRISQLQLEELEGAKTEREAFAASPEAAAQKRVQALATENLLARLEGRSPVLPPEAEARVGTAFGAAKTRGLEDLTRLANETAAMRGMTRADSPVAAPFLQESGRFIQGLEGTRAQAELDVGQTEALFSQSLADFQSRLQQQAFMNRLALAGGTFAPQAGMMAQNLFAQRLASDPRSQTMQQFPSTLQLAQGYTQLGGQLAGAVGGAMLGASTARVKRAITPLTVHDHAEALRTVRQTPIVRYRYRWETDADRVPHIGPILETSPALLTDDGVHVNLLDYLGLLHAALIALDRKVNG